MFKNSDDVELDKAVMLIIDTVAVFIAPRRGARSVAPGIVTAGNDAGVRMW